MDHHPKITDWILLLVLSLIWGSSFILMKEGLKAFRPEQVACIRIGVTGIVLLPFAFQRKKFVDGPKTKTILLQGMFGNFIPAFLFTAAQSTHQQFTRRYSEFALAGLGVDHRDFLFPLSSKVASVARHPYGLRWRGSSYPS